MSSSGTSIASLDRPMRALTVTDVTRIATEAARQQSPKLQVIGVTLGGQGKYAEIIVDIAGCRTQPCRFSVGVFRDATPAALREEISGQLQRHIREHRE